MYRFKTLLLHHDKGQFICMCLCLCLRETDTKCFVARTINTLDLLHLGTRICL